MSQWERIAELAKKHNISWTKLAKVAGVAPSAVTKWRSGGGIKTDALNRIAMHFGVSADWLLAGISSVRLEPQIRDRLFEAKGATGMTPQDMADLMGVSYLEVAAAMNGASANGEFINLFDAHLQPLINAVKAKRTELPSEVGSAPVPSPAPLEARVTQLESKVETLTQLIGAQLPKKMHAPSKGKPE